MKRTIVRLLSFTVFVLMAQVVSAKLMLITIPKSGTHLLHKCLNLIDKRKLPFSYGGELPFQKWYEQSKEKNALPPPNHWKGQFHPSTINETVLAIKKSCTDKKNDYSSHAYYTEDYNVFLDSKNFKKIVMLRDPRAIVVSYANMVKDGFEPHHKVDFEDLLLDLIDGRQQHYISWATSKNTAYPAIWEMGLCNFYKLYLPFISTKNCLTVRFENLVGEQGGGSQELQRAEIQKILKHLGIFLDSRRFDKVMEKLFGDSVTFYQGTIDGWKKYFTPKIKEAFKAVPGANELLVLLGYEQNADW